MTEPSKISINYHVHIRWHPMQPLDKAGEDAHPNDTPIIWYIYRICDQHLSPVRIVPDLQRWAAGIAPEEIANYCVKWASIHVDEPIYDSVMIRLLDHVISYLNRWTHNEGAQPNLPCSFSYLISNEQKMPENLARLMLYRPGNYQESEIYNLHRRSE